MKLLTASILLCFVAIVKASPRIVGGTAAPDGKFPYMVSLRVDGRYKCGGSIINNRWILTAAHCLDGQDPRSIVAQVGTNKLVGDDNAQRYQVEYSTYHWQWNTTTLTNDIGLVRVDKDIVFGPKVQPVTLTKYDISEPGAEAVLCGWGATRVTGIGPAPTDLQQMTAKLVSQETCSKIWADQYPITDAHICTSTPVRVGACSGDSGGPLVVNGVQVGVTSFARPCARGVPDVFARVFTFLDWIKEEQEKFY